MSSKSDYLEAKLQNHVLGNTAYSAPATVYFALYVIAPSDTGGGTEASGNGYARVAVTNNTTNFGAPVGNVKSNSTDIVFPTATGGWGGAVTSVGVLDAASGGNLLMWATLGANVTVASGDIPTFAAGNFTWTED